MIRAAVEHTDRDHRGSGRLMTLALLACSILFLTAEAEAFPAGAMGKNRVEGSVMSEGHPVKGARIDVLDEMRNRLPRFWAETDLQGRFSLSGLSDGSYILKVQAEGFETREISFDTSEGREEQLSETMLGGRLVVKEVILLPIGVTILPEEDLSPFPGKAAKLYKKAQRKLKAGDRREAEDLLRQALALAPEFHYALVRLGEIQKLDGRLDEARENLKQAVQLNSGEVVGRSLLAKILLDEASYEPAVLLLEEAVTSAPRYPDAWFNLGLALFHLDRTEKAEEALLRALALDPEGLVSARLLLANVHLKEQSLDKALEEMERFLAVKPDSPLAPAVLEKVELLRNELDSTEQE